MACGKFKWSSDRMMMLGEAVDMYSQGKSWEEIKSCLDCTEYEFRIIRSKIKACVKRDWTK